jgi:adenosylcobinamide kinase/adenosylcobinamide-phosphate guanylyltransferase
MQARQGAAIKKMKTLITGGARSGKTAFALNRALTRASSEHGRIYIATAELLDDEMRRRAERHRNERGSGWQTIEEPYELDAILPALNGTVVVDCLTLWLSNWFLRDPSSVAAKVSSLVAAARTVHYELILITNEVGCSIVPENRLAREFRDWSGFMNQQIAEAVEEVYLTVCGQPLRIK